MSANNDENILHVGDILTAELLAERLKVKVEYVNNHATLFVGYFKVGGLPRYDWSEIEHAIKMQKNLVQKMTRPA